MGGRSSGVATGAGAMVVGIVVAIAMLSRVS